MKAWQLQSLGRENLTLNDIPQPTPGTGEALVRISSVSLNYREKLIYDGHYNPQLQFPITQVSDAVGEVVGLGSNTTRLRIGDRVITNYCTRWIDGQPTSSEAIHTLGCTIPGALAEYLVLSEQALVPVPAYMTDDEAASLPCAALTAWFSLVEKGGLTVGQTVLLQGTGGVALFALQIATALGATVIITSSSDEKLERARTLGAHHTINYSRTPDWDKEALALTNGLGADHVLELVGGPHLISSLNAVKPTGQISVIGLMQGISCDVPLFLTMVKQITLRGVCVGPRRALEDMLRKFDELRLHPVIDSTYSFADAPKAFERLEQGAFGKIVIHVRD
jgi:NADPH:quinone reductase-like Zn-dependent oxidoreductase